MATRKMLAAGLAASLAILCTAPVLAKGVLRATISTSLNQLDPARHTIGDEYIYGLLVFGGLVAIDEDLKYRGELAEKWEASEDLRTWTFHLRKGVKFHHGKDFGSDDVAATFKHIANPATGSSGRTHMDN